MNRGHAEFIGLGHLSSKKNRSSEAFAISADGGAIVGWALSDKSRGATVPFLYAAGQMNELTRSPSRVPLQSGQASSISADATTVVGFTQLNRAFVWTVATDIELLPNLSPHQIGAQARGVSGDGGVVVGFSEPGQGRTEGFRWTRQAGIRQLSALPGFPDFSANSVSSDGHVIVGSCRNHFTNTGWAISWSADGKVTNMGGLPGAKFSGAMAISPDGQVVVGNSDRTGCYWKAGGKVEPIMAPNNHRDWPVPQGVSDNGRVIVGQFGQSAFIWDKKNGFRLLYDTLVNEYGLGQTLAGWTLRSAEAINASGEILAGYGTNPSGEDEAYKVTIGA